VFFSKPLNQEHVRALAALLGKEMPLELTICLESRVFLSAESLRYFRNFLSIFGVR
jgi:hypothetical protein